MTPTNTLRAALERIDKTEAESLEAVLAAVTDGDVRVAVLTALHPLSEAIRAGLAVASSTPDGGLNVEVLATVLRTLWPDDPWIDAETIGVEYTRARTQQLIDANRKLLAEGDRLRATLAAARLPAAEGSEEAVPRWVSDRQAEPELFDCPECDHEVAPGSAQFHAPRCTLGARARPAAEGSEG